MKHEITKRGKDYVCFRFIANFVHSCIPFSFMGLTIMSVNIPEWSPRRGILFLRGYHTGQNHKVLQASVIDFLRINGALYALERKQRESHTVEC